MLFPSVALAWHSDMTDYGYRLPITINSAPVVGSAALNEFVLYIEIDDESDLSSGTGHVEDTTNGYDVVWVVDDDGVGDEGDGTSTVLHYERLTYDSSGDWHGWVEVINSKVHGTSDGKIWIYYGKSGDSDHQNVNGTWTTAAASHDWELVAHLETDGSFIDSAGNHTLTDNSVTTTTGKVKTCANFATANATVALTSAITFDDNYTHIAWLNYDNSDYHCWCGDTSLPTTDYMSRHGTGNVNVALQNNQLYTATLSNGNWHFVVVRKNSSNVWTLDIDGTNKACAGICNRLSALNVKHIGAGYNTTQYSWDGKIDEFMIAKTSLLSDDWIDSMKANADNPDSFITIGTEEAGGVEICDNGEDDDGDSYIDCADSDCLGEMGPVCTCRANEVGYCSNSCDDDGDGDADLCDSDCSGSSTHSETQDVALSTLDGSHPTGLGTACDVKCESQVADSTETFDNGDPGATSYACGYFYVDSEGLTTSTSFQVATLQHNDETEAAYIKIVQDASDNLEVEFWHYHEGAWKNTQTAHPDTAISIDVWYFYKIYYADDACTFDLYSCDYSIYSSIMDYDPTIGSGAERTADQLLVGVKDNTSCTGATVVYCDAHDLDFAAMRGALGIIKQNLNPDSYFVTDWEPSHANDGDIILFDGFNARSYHDDSGYEFGGWGASAQGTKDPNYAGTTMTGPYAMKFLIEGTDVQANIYETGLATSNDYTWVKTKFDIYIEDDGNASGDRTLFRLYGSGCELWTMYCDAEPTQYLRFDEGSDLLGSYEYAEDQRYRVEVEWKYGASANGIFNVKVTNLSTGATTNVVTNSSRTSDCTELDNIGLGIIDGAADDCAFYFDELYIKDCSVDSSWMGAINQAAILSDDSDSSYFGCDTEADSYGQNEHNCVMSFSNPDHMGSVKELRLFAKAKEYSSLHNRVRFGAYYEPGAADLAYNAPEKPTYFALAWEWMMMSWDRDPAMTLKYTDDVDFENDATVGDQLKGAESNISAYIVAIDKGNDKITIAKVQGYDASAWGYDGAGYCFFNGEALDYVSGGTNSTTVASDYDTEDPQEALSWTIADDFLGQVATLPTARFDDDYTDSGGKVSEMFAQVLSTEDSQETLTHFIGSTAWTETSSPYDNGIGIKGRTSGPAYVEVRYGATEADVKANTGDTWTTNTGTLTSSDDDYTFQINILEDQTVKTTAGGNHTVDYATDGLNNAVIYFDIRIKGQSASDWYSWYRLEGLGGTDNNPVVQDMTNDLLATKAFPAHDYTGTLWFVQMADDHGIDHPALWAQMETKMNTNNAAFFLHLGDEVPDPGDRLCANRRMWKNFSGFQGKRFTWTHVRTRWPYIKSYSDHDFFVNDATKAGSMQYGKTSLTYLRVYVGLQTNLEWTPFPMTCDVNGANCTYLLSPDYNGNYMTDLTGTASGGDANTLDDTDAGRDFDNPSHASWVPPGGSVVHNITDNTVTVVSSVTDDDTLEMAWNLQDFDGDTGSTFDVGDEYRVARTGTWRHLQWGAVAEFWVTDSRALSDPSSVIGCDFYDGRAYGSASKDSGTTADPPGGSDTFKLYEAAQNFSSTVHVGDGVIITKSGTDYYAHVSEVTDNATLVLDRDIAGSPFGHSYTIHEAGGSIHGSHQTNHEAGHIQRTWLEKTIGDSTRLAKFVISDTNIRHNAARWHDSISDRDGVCYGDSVELAKAADPGCCPVSADYPRPLATKLDIDDDTGWDADNYIKGNTSGARARINSVSDDTLTFYTEFGGIADGDDKGWGHVIHGEFLVGETVTEYTDYALSISDATATAQAPPTDAEFKADDPATFADYNRFWKASGTREHTMQYLNVFANIFYLVGDRHYHAICDATHSDDFFIQVDASPCGWNYTKGWTGWGIDDDEDGHIQADEMAFVHEENLSASDAGAFALIEVDYGSNVVQIDMIKPDGTTWGNSDVTNTGVSLSLTIYPSLTWIDEDFEEEGGEEDWLTHLRMHWYADDYWFDEAVGM